MLVRSGIQLIEYRFSISDDGQRMRFLGRIHDPLKQGKLSPIDLESRRRWDEYIKAKQVMLERSHIPEAPRWVVRADDKKKARPNWIHHLLGKIHYEDIERPAIKVPARECHYARVSAPQDIVVPEVY
jgi:polyphosphate kinase 2 (PPK2 family)